MDPVRVPLKLGVDSTVERTLLKDWGLKNIPIRRGPKTWEKVATTIEGPKIKRLTDGIN